MNTISRSEILACLLAALLWCVPAVVSAQAGSEPSFEVVSIRPSGPGEHRWSLKDSGDRMSLTGVNARTLVADAYGKDLPNVVGGPAWIDSEQYDVAATFGNSDAAKLTPYSKDRMDQIYLLLRTAMAQRFGLKIHHETREVPVYALVLAKGGPKFGPLHRLRTKRRLIKSELNTTDICGR